MSTLRDPRRPGRARGFTLLEVVVALALLALVSVALFPILIDATRATAAPVREVDPTDLREFLTAFLADERRVADLLGRDELRESFDLRGERHEVTLRRVFWPDGRCPHDWVELRCGATRVFRYLPRATEEKVATTMGAYR